MPRFAILLVAVIAVASVSHFAANAAVQPAPGDLMIINDLTLSSGECAGEVKLFYGFLAEQIVRQWAIHTQSDCSVITEETAADGSTWRPLGPTYTSFYGSWDGKWARNTLHYNYDLVENCPPEWKGMTSDSNWLVIAEQFHYKNNSCEWWDEVLWLPSSTNDALPTFDLVSIAAPTYVACIAEANPDSAVVSCVTHTTVSIPVLEAPIEIATIPAGDSETKTVGSGLL